MSGQGKARYAFENHTHSGLGSGGSGSGGTTIYSGSGSPTSSIGVAGDFYVDTTNKVFWGPKVGTSWPSSFSLAGTPGATGPAGPAGAAGAAGTNGTNGAAATVTVGATSVGLPGTAPVVTNSGTSTNAILNFTIPRGATGATGPQGPAGPQGPQGPAGTGTSSAVSTMVPVDILTDWYDVLNPNVQEIGLPLATGASATTTVSSPLRNGELWQTFNTLTWNVTCLSSDTLITGVDVTTTEVLAAAALNWAIQPVGNPLLFKVDLTVGTKATIYVKHSLSVSTSARIAIHNFLSNTDSYGNYVTIPANTWTAVTFDLTTLSGAVCYLSVQWNITAASSGTLAIGPAFLQTTAVLDPYESVQAQKNFYALAQARSAAKNSGIPSHTNATQEIFTTSFNYRIINSGGKYRYQVSNNGVLGLSFAPREFSSEVFPTVDQDVELSIKVGDGLTSGTVQIGNVYCSHVPNGGPIIYLGPDKDKWLYLKLKYAGDLGWICIDHIKDVPSPTIQWPSVIPGTSTSSYLRGSTTRYKNAYQDIDVYIEALVSYIPAIVRQKLYDYGWKYTTGRGFQAAEPGWDTSAGTGNGLTVLEKKTILVGDINQPKLPLWGYQFFGHNVKNIIHETAHALSLSWITANNLSSNGQLTVNGVSFTRMENHPTLTQIFADAKNDVNTIRPQYAFDNYANTATVNNTVEWFAEIMACRWLSLEGDLMRLMGAMQLYFQQLSWSSANGGTLTIILNSPANLTVGDPVYFQSNTLGNGLTILSGTVSKIINSTTFEMLGQVPSVTITTGYAGQRAYTRMQTFLSWCISYGF